MTTDKTPATLAVDVMAVLRRHAESHRASAGSDAYSAQEAPRLEGAVAAVAELIEATTALRARLCLHGDWEDRCFYYNGYSAPELMAPMADVDAALARVKGESA